MAAAPLPAYFTVSELGRFTSEKHRPLLRRLKKEAWDEKDMRLDGNRWRVSRDFLQQKFPEVMTLLEMAYGHRCDSDYDYARDADGYHRYRDAIQDEGCPVGDRGERTINAWGYQYIDSPGDSRHGTYDRAPSLENQNSKMPPPPESYPVLQLARRLREDPRSFRRQLQRKANLQNGDLTRAGGKLWVTRKFLERCFPAYIPEIDEPSCWPYEGAA